VRMLRIELVQKDVLLDLEQTLRTEFMSNLARSDRRDNHEVMAEIFNSLDRATEARFLEMLEERNKDAADRIRALMFTFEDLIKLDAQGMQTLLRNIDTSSLGLALEGASEKVRELFFKNMSERAGKILREDMEAMGPVRLKDVDEAQMHLVNTAKDLSAKGEIVIADVKGDDELVY
jgi:flagellar motor switch protein FliG